VRIFFFFFLSLFFRADSYFVGFSITAATVEGSFAARVQLGICLLRSSRWRRRSGSAHTASLSFSKTISSNCPDRNHSNTSIYFVYFFFVFVFCFSFFPFLFPSQKRVGRSHSFLWYCVLGVFPGSVGLRLLAEGLLLQIDGERTTNGDDG